MCLPRFFMNSLFFHLKIFLVFTTCVNIHIALKGHENEKGIQINLFGF